MYSIYLSINQRRRYLPEIWTIFWKDTQTDRPTDIHCGLQGSYTSNKKIPRVLKISVLLVLVRFLMDFINSVNIKNIKKKFIKRIPILLFRLY